MLTTSIDPRRAAFLTATSVVDPSKATIASHLDRYGYLTGRLEQISLSPGKFVQENSAVTGASDGSTVVLSIKPAESLSTLQATCQDLISAITLFQQRFAAAHKTTNEAEAIWQTESAKQGAMVQAADNAQ